ncbi:MAG: pyridoxamine 5'-phosphate oxidase family protein [Limnospira sp.]
MTFHRGELEVQIRVGVRKEAEAVCRMISPTIKPAAREFLQHQFFAIAASVDGENQVWASPLAGKPGFIHILSDSHLSIYSNINEADPLRQNLADSDSLGLLAIDLLNRRRLRLNGKAKILADGSIYLETQQVFFNCPQYIQKRHLVEIHQIPKISQTFNSQKLSHNQQDWIAQADTFFIASSHPQRGTDASHRGGYPGFIKILDSGAIVFPDYSGNNMFQTLGNLIVNPKAGLLFIDFERGHTLQLTGTTAVIWEGSQLSEFEGARRLVEFHIDRVLEISHACPMRWEFEEYSPANPSNKRS